MNKLAFTFLLSIISSASIFSMFDVFIDNPTQMDTTDSDRKVEMTFDMPHQNLGSIKRGEKRETSFKFVNTGNEDIQIELVSACECSTLDWPRRAIRPGSTGEITVIFDSTEKEESETIEIDIHLKNTDPKTGYPILEIVSYKFELIQ